MSIKTAIELRDAKQKRAELFTQLKDTNKAEMSSDEQRAWDALKAEYETLDADIVSYESAQARNNAVENLEQRHNPANPSTGPPAARAFAQVRGTERLRVFSNLGEQLAAVRTQALTGQGDERLNQLQNEARALGMQESVGADGGFVIQTDFTGQIFESAAQEGDWLPLIDTYEVGANSNSARWIEVDESDVSTTVFGGVQVYWAAEAKTVAASKPEIQEQKIDLEKLMGFAYTTEETMQDSTFATQLYTQAFGLAINRQLEGDSISGNGIGKLLGILKSPALLQVSKESGQTAKIVVENFAHMWGRLLSRLRRNSVWLMHPDLEEILPLMSFPVGTGGVPIFLPAGGISGSPLSTLYGRPIISMDHCSALGSKGDVILTDPKQYGLFRKGGVQAASSIHVAFLSAETCFRIIARANGRPKMSKQITIKNSSNKRSAYVTLEAR